MLKDIKAVFFDLDGTLVDSMHIWKDIDIEFLARFGYDLPPTLQSEIEGMAFRETAVYFKERFNIPLSLQEIMNCWNEMAYQKYKEEIGYKPGAFDFLKKLKSMQLKTCICTSNSKELVDVVGTSLGFKPYFDEIITACEVRTGKPAPDIYLEAAKRVKVSPENCLVLEDTIAGIKAGLNAGMKVCAVDDAFTAQKREEKKALADYFIVDYFEL